MDIQPLPWVWLLAHFVLQDISLGNKVSNSDFPLQYPRRMHYLFLLPFVYCSLANFWAIITCSVKASLNYIYWDYEVLSNTWNSFLLCHLATAFRYYISVYLLLLHIQITAVCYILIALQFTFCLHISRNHNLHFCDLVKLAIF